MDFNSRKAVVTHAPTVRRASQWLQLSVAPGDRTLTVFLRDIIQAYTQSKTRLRQTVFIRPPSVLRYPQHIVSRQLPTRLPAIIWGSLEFYIQNISHNITPYESLDLLSVFLFDKGCISSGFNSRIFPRGLVCLQTDDTVYVSKTPYIKLEAKKRNQFDSKDTVVLSRVKTCKFNGWTLHFDGTIYKNYTAKPYKKEDSTHPSNFTPDDFISERARGANISAVCRP